MIADSDQAHINYILRSLSSGWRVLVIGASEDAALMEKLAHQVPRLKIVGIDCSPSVYDLPFYWRIKYLYGDVTNINFPPHLFDAAIALSNPACNGGYEVAWKKVSEALKPGARLFARGIYALIGSGLKRISEENGWSVYVNERRLPGRELSKIYLYGAHGKQSDGLSHYIDVLARRLRRLGIDVVYGLPPSGATDGPVLVEYEELEVKYGGLKPLEELPSGAFVEIHSTPRDMGRKDLIYLYHGIPSYYMPKSLNLTWYYVPHIAYDVNVPVVNKIYDFCSFGTYTTSKGFECIKLLKGKKRLLVSFVYLLKNDDFIREACRARLGRLGGLCKHPFVNSSNLIRFLKMKLALLRLYGVSVEIRDWFPEDELIGELAKCKALVFFQRTDAPSSGSMRLAAALGVPVYARDNMRSKDSQAIRFRDVREIYSLPRDRIFVDDGLDYLLAALRYGRLGGQPVPQQDN
jgi:hypothetical protein